MRIILFFISLFIFSGILAQRKCGTVDYYNSMKSTLMVNGQPILQSNSSNARDPYSNEMISIPVVIHVLYNTAIQNISDAQIISQLQVLNEDFNKINKDTINTPSVFKQVAAACNISFCLAKLDAQGRTTTGIIRKYTSKTSFSIDDAMKYASSGGDDSWDCKKYLNIWICNLQSSTIGYSTPPNGQIDRDGVVIQYDCFGTTGNIKYPFNKGRTATHEIGHWLGLRHIWGDNICGSDGIDDTPNQSSCNFNCPSFPKLSDCSPNANGDMFMNFMDYTDDACMNMFSDGQKNLIRGLFSSNGPRNSFLYSFGCDSSLVESGATLPSDTIVNDVKKEPSILIFPNPAHFDLKVFGENGYQLMGKRISVFSTSGKLLITKRATANNANIDLSMLKPGLYLLKVEDDVSHKIMKFIKF